MNMTKSQGCCLKNRQKAVMIKRKYLYTVSNGR